MFNLTIQDPVISIQVSLTWYSYIAEFSLKNKYQSKETNLRTKNSTTVTSEILHDEQTAHHQQAKM